MSKKQSKHYAKSVKSGNKIKSRSLSKKSSSSSSKSTRSNSPTKKSSSPTKSNSSSKNKKLRARALKKKKTRRIKRGNNFSWRKYMLIGLASLGRQMVNKEPEKFKDFPDFDFGNNTEYGFPINDGPQPSFSGNNAVYEFPINEGPPPSFSGRMLLDTGLLNRQRSGHIMLSKLPYATSKIRYDGTGGYVRKRRKTKRKTKRRRKKQKR